jgi:hypothetical protein
LILINGFIAFILYLLPTIDPAEMQGANSQPLNIMALSMFFSFATVAGSIGMIILVQDEIIQEKQSGTAAWILSKPVARPAFIFSKWLSNIIGGLIFIVVLPGVVTAAEIALAGQPATPLLPFVFGAAVVALTLIFYISLVIMSGVLFEQRGPVLGAVFGKRIADAVALQDDMELIGVSDVISDWRIQAALEKGYHVFAATQDAGNRMKAEGISVSGDLNDLLSQIDVVIDATPKKVAAANLEKYKQDGVKSIFQGGEKHSLTGHSFVAQANYETAIGRDMTRVVSCNTTSIVRVMGANARTINSEIFTGAGKGVPTRRITP